MPKHYQIVNLGNGYFNKILRLGCVARKFAPFLNYSLVIINMDFLGKLLTKAVCQV